MFSINRKNAFHYSFKLYFLKKLLIGLYSKHKEEEKLF